MFSVLINLGNYPDWIQAVCAIIVMICTIIMACYAKDALHTWKHQKKHDIVSEGKANMLVCIELFSKLTHFEELAYNGTEEDEKDGYKKNLSLFLYQISWRSLMQK